ncbi:sulfite exporter TauE/SafE family protein [Thalassiella azotivora]
MSAVDVLLLLAAGVAAGVVGAGAGLASLVSYPALLAVGLPPLAANVTNTVSLTLTGAGAITGSRPELAGQAWRVRRFALMGLLGGTAGAALLLTTPAEAFEAVVPALVGFASLALLARPWLARWHSAEPRDRHPAVSAGTALVAVYGGYFGAAAGVLLLAMLGAVVREPIARVNALKNVVLFSANVVAATGFAVFGPVRWWAALPLAAGCFLGGLVAPAVVRRLPETGLRLAIGTAGLVLAAVLAADAWV